MVHIKSNFFTYLAAIIFGFLISIGINKVVEDTSSLAKLEILSTPVLQNVEIIEYSYVDEPIKGLKIHVVGEKIRNDCGSPQNISGYYGQPLKPFEKVAVVKPDDQIIDDYIERPAIVGEQQDFGWWILTPDPVGPFYLFLDYICGQNSIDNTSKPYPYRTIIGPFEIFHDLTK